jgi:hypothetical protein
VAVLWRQGLGYMSVEMNVVWGRVQYRVYVAYGDRITDERRILNGFQGIGRGTILEFAYED